MAILTSAATLPLLSPPPWHRNPSYLDEQASYTEGVIDNGYGGGFALQEEEITGDGAEVEFPFCPQPLPVDIHADEVQRLFLLEDSLGIL